jgi:hypothetical protein
VDEDERRPLAADEVAQARSLDDELALLEAGQVGLCVRQPARLSCVEMDALGGRDL